MLTPIEGFTCFSHFLKPMTKGLINLSRDTRQRIIIINQLKVFMQRFIFCQLNPAL